MVKKLNEVEVLQKLDIPDFRHLSKDKVVELASMLNEMAPEVAVKALEQIPDATETFKDIVLQLKSLAAETLQDNANSYKSFNATCDAIISSLEKILESDKDLSFEQKQVLIQQMIELAKMKDAKDTENKKFNLKILQIAASVAVVFGLTVAAIFGVNIKGLLGHPDIDV